MLDTKTLKELINIPEDFKTDPKKRPSWDIFFMGLTYFVSTRSSCIDRKVGAIIVKDKTIIATGMNGAPRGIEDCMERNECIRKDRDKSLGKDYENCYSAHAEVNAIANHAFVGGPDMKNSTLYTVVFPCVICAKLIINAGIKRIVYAEGLKNDSGLGEQMFREVGIETERVRKNDISKVMYRALEFLVDRDEEGNAI